MASSFRVRALAACLGGAALAFERTVALLGQKGDRYGVAGRAHGGLILLQMLLAYLAACTLFAAAFAQPSTRRTTWVVASAAALVACVALFLTPGLMDYGAFEN